MPRSPLARVSRRPHPEPPAALRLLTGLALAMATAACSPSRRDHVEPALLADSMGIALTDTATTGEIASSDLVEVSGLAASRTHPGFFYTMNDSGNDPVLFAVDRTGADAGQWRVAGAVDDDWESIAVGPCQSSAPSPSNTASCVYIGDTGDNRGNASDRTIYRVAEPAVPDTTSGDSVRFERALVYRYSDHPRDVEAMYVGPDGTVWLISKRREKASGGRLRPALVFRLTPDAWERRGLQMAELVDSLPIVPGTAIGREVTDASIAPDGARVAVRTYSQVLIFAADSTTGRIRGDVAPVTCNLAPLLEAQGEAVAWRSPTELVFLSEGKHVPVHTAGCGSGE